MNDLLGKILIAVGILVAGGSGVCSVIVLSGAMGTSSFWQSLLYVAALGGLPLVAGIGCVIGERSLLRPAQPTRTDEA